MNDAQIKQQARDYMAALPTPFALDATAGGALAAPTDGELAQLVAAHCPLAVSLFVQHLTAYNYMDGDCPADPPFAIAHASRALYAGAHVASFGYNTLFADPLDNWPENGAACLECWLADHPGNMALALQYMDCLRPPGIPALIAGMLDFSSGYMCDDLEDGELVPAPAL